ncbi:hypothetical protein M8998_15400 [Sphingobacterium sp. lm-10]|uniref:hypothetical protein n=1 Tax=Sphingobacterium sp. lm-10 TaxID=2944904 RepID=UPI0020218C99|nr:hypothetical protein [Sphingobacterium sp. lm-10]MCL7989336.1 hypothetical protein [Sphingobacterium sp. lm-10]
MKRILLALVIASATMLSFNSCTKEYITNNESLPGLSFYKDLLGGSAWRPVSGRPNEFEQTIALPELDQVAFEDGHVSVSIGTRTSNGIDEFFNIPGTVDGRTYDVRYAVGRVTFTVFTNGSVPATQVAKIVLTDASVGN